jgi:capsular polysaccharide biosynthesis protein
MNSNEEITLHQVLQIFTKRWKYLLLLALVFILGALIKHKYFPMYPGTGKLIIKDVRNSQLQLVLSTVAGPGTEVAPDAKSDDVVDRAETVLDTHEYYVALAARLLQLKNEQNNQALINFFKKFEGDQKDPEFLHDVGNTLAGMISFNSSKGGVLVINTKTYNRELSVVVVNEALKEAQKNIIDRELEDLNRAESYFNVEIESVRSRLDSIENSTVKKLQKNQILSVDMEKGDSSRYISELKKNINDTKISISNNESRINSLTEKIKNSGSKDLGVISKFNESSQIKMLEDQNRDLQIELKTYQSYLRNYESQKTGLVPMQYELQKMNANHDFEYKMFASLNDSLARIGLQKTYVKNKVDILERERFSKVRSSPSLGIMILISLMLSQVIGMFSIYVYELFRPTTPENIS